eukprot:gb/GECG01000691.1/.p1 GENE.gb/GECG01000691.1/~~gb/GECG01000691.1/.p1  ORF type:complete len:108 (+),score=11.67 gb/GECG01000691.1/:1-324(+)
MSGSSEGSKAYCNASSNKPEADVSSGGKQGRKRRQRWRTWKKNQRKKRLRQLYYQNRDNDRHACVNYLTGSVSPPKIVEKQDLGTATYRNGSRPAYATKHQSGTNHQ